MIVYSFLFTQSEEERWRMSVCSWQKRRHRSFFIKSAQRVRWLMKMLPKIFLKSDKKVSLSGEKFCSRLIDQLREFIVSSLQAINRLIYHFSFWGSIPKLIAHVCNMDMRCFLYESLWHGKKASHPTDTHSFIHSLRLIILLSSFIWSQGSFSPRVCVRTPRPHTVLPYKGHRIRTKSIFIWLCYPKAVLDTVS